MSRRLRIVHLEDSAPEAVLIRGHLAEGGLDCDIRRVDTGRDFEVALADHCPDLILADFSLPSFDGPSALRIARARCPEVPVIFVSGALSEEAAVELVKAGAVDFVRKDRPGRLMPAIERALREVDERRERRRAEEALRSLNEELEHRVRVRTMQLEASTAKLRELAIKLTNAEQRERERLAHILHDNLQQLLVAARMHVSALQGRTLNEGLQREMARVEDLLRQSLETSRSLTQNLCPLILFDRGIGAAVEWACRRAHEEHRLVVDLEVDPDAQVDVEALRIVLFEAVRELLFNVVKHSGVLAARVVVSRPVPLTIRIAVEDAGKGVNPEAMAAENRDNKGWGIFSIRERLVLLGGTLEFVPPAGGRGTCVVLTAPCSLRGPATPGEPALPPGKSSVIGPGCSS